VAGEAPQDELASWPTGRLLSTAARAVEHAWAEALQTLGVTHAGLIALHLLRDGPLSQIQLARSAHVETQTMSRTLERLEREGLVSRAPDPQDRRRHVVARTTAGTDAWERATPGPRAPGARACATWSASRRARSGRAGSG
jgi:DNA-binding MarR family transcriptional regulator